MLTRNGVQVDKEGRLVCRAAEEMLAALEQVHLCALSGFPVLEQVRFGAFSGRAGT